MEFWIKQESDSLHLPVPSSEFKIARGGNNETFKVENLGEISFIGKTNLATISFESFFPAKQYTYCQYKMFPSPFDCVALIDKWQNSGKPVIFTVTGTNINFECTIDNFEYSQKDGTGDIFFTIELKEYRRIIITTNIATAVNTGLKRVVNKVVPKTYTVIDGDSLYKIALNKYGNGSLWPVLFNKNQPAIKNPNQIYPGQVIKL